VRGRSGGAVFCFKPTVANTSRWSNHQALAPFRNSERNRPRKSNDAKNIVLWFGGTRQHRPWVLSPDAKEWTRLRKAKNTPRKKTLLGKIKGGCQGVRKGNAGRGCRKRVQIASRSPNSSKTSWYNTRKPHWVGEGTQNCQVEEDP